MNISWPFASLCEYNYDNHDKEKENQIVLGYGGPLVAISDFDSGSNGL